MMGISSGFEGAFIVWTDMHKYAAPQGDTLGGLGACLSRKSSILESWGSILVQCGQTIWGESFPPPP